MGGDDNYYFDRRLRRVIHYPSIWARRAYLLTIRYEYLVNASGIEKNCIISAILSLYAVN